MAKQWSAGKVALVTGGASGIGRSCARRFTRQGASVVVCDVAVEGGEETVRLIGDDAGEAFFVKADVSTAADVEALVKTAVDAHGRIDYAFNNAGIEGTMATNTADYLEQDWDRVIAINLKGLAVHETRDRADGQARRRCHRQQLLG